MGAAVIAAAAAKAEREIVEHLRREGATSPERAATLPELHHLGRRRLERLLTAGAVREAPNGYWLDEPIYESYRSDRRGIALVVLGVIVVALAGVLIARMLKG
jgi:hypothetical protein